MERLAGFFLCPVILILAPTAGEEIIVHASVVNGTVGQSILLPMSYKLTSQFSRYTIQWDKGKQNIVDYLGQNCTIDSQGFPTWEHGITTINAEDKRQIEFYKRNGSLMLQDLQLKDEGIYVVTFINVKAYIKKEIQVWIHQNCEADNRAFDGITGDNNKTKEVPTTHMWEIIFIIRTVLSFLLVFMLVYLICRWECQP